MSGIFHKLSMAVLTLKILFALKSMTIFSKIFTMASGTIHNGKLKDFDYSSIYTTIDISMEDYQFCLIT